MAKEKSSRMARLARGRVWVQAAFLLAWLDPLMIRMHTICGPVFHCYSCPWATFACPIGVLANFSAFGIVPFAAIGTLLVAGAVFGSFVCGWACPFGFLQDVVGWIPTRKFPLPAWLSGFRYVVLAVFVLAIPFVWGEGHPLFFCRLCPAGARGSSAQRGAAGHHGPAHRLADGHEVDYSGRVRPGHALRLAAVVHVVLPAGGDLRTVEPRFDLLPPLSSR